MLSFQVVPGFCSCLITSSDLNHTNIFIAFKNKMAVLTITANSNDHMVHFRKPHRHDSKKYQHRLVSCSLFNPWFNLKWTGEISGFNAYSTATVKIIPKGNYSPNSLGHTLQDTLKSEGWNENCEGVLEIHNPQNKHVLHDNDLADLLGIKCHSQTINLIKRFSSSIKYCVHCDLLDINESAFSGEP